MHFADRADAGRRLAERLHDLRHEALVVLGLPRGGVPVAFEVARALDAPMDVILVRKLGVPSQPELAMGALGEGGVRVINEETMRLARVGEQELAEIEDRERAELDRRADVLRLGQPPLSLEGRTALLIDDGVATGSTARAACAVARAQGAARVVLAVPVAPRGWTARLGNAADDYVCLHASPSFYAVGQFYADFTPTTDDVVIDLLRRAASEQTPTPATTAGDPPVHEEEIAFRVGPVRLAGRLAVPDRPSGIVLFAHGSGSSHHSPRNRFVARTLQQAGMATLLFDLLTPDEELDRGNVFDIDLLGARLADVTRSLPRLPQIAGLPVGYFGASTGAAAALWAAAEPDIEVAAIVSRGGRPDLAESRLPAVTAPTLLIVGGRDSVVIELNRDAQVHLRCASHLLVIPGATHLFEEPGTLAAAADAARDWFFRHFAAIVRPRIAASGLTSMLGSDRRLGR